MRKKERVRLMDLSELPHPKVVEHERKPEEVFESQRHRLWVALQPCHACGAKEPLTQIEAAHLRKGAGAPRGGGKKDDFWCWPGCIRCHENLQHTIGED